MRWWVVLLGMVAAEAGAQTSWFTVASDPARADVDTVQVDPVAIRAGSGQKTMNVRVNRAGERRNWEQLPYRSYQSRVVFDCRAGKASYVRASFYAMPLWQGEPYHHSNYGDSPRPMLLLDMAPNPTQRLIRAACRSDA